jgi:hypothetical protein
MAVVLLRASWSADYRISQSLLRDFLSTLS